MVKVLDRVKAAFGRAPKPAGNPQARYFGGQSGIFMGGPRPALRENWQDVQQAWGESAARVIEAWQNSGFIYGVVEAASASTVGSGLRMSARPDGVSLGWTPERTQSWARMVESRWASYSSRPIECDAAGKLTVAQMQQAAFAQYLIYGETLAIMPIVPRAGVTAASKVALIPPSRLVDKTTETSRLYQGVYVDAWGMPEQYLIREKSPWMGDRDILVNARDRDGRRNVLHVFEPGAVTTRGISPMAPALKVIKQVEQYANATLHTALIQTMFAATMRTGMNGIQAYEGLMTNADVTGNPGALDINKFGEAKAEWYEDAKIDLNQTGRIAHLFPGDELDFKAAQHPNSNFDVFMRWLLTEICRCAGVTYESGTGDYRGATYSSVRMAGALEWLTVMRRRENIVIPFVQAIYENWLEEEVGSGRIEFPGGVQAFYQQRGLACHTVWTGPPRPQADEFKAARSMQVRKEIGATTMAEIAAEYGMDWDDMMRQQKAENDLADELDLPRPWAITDPMQKPEGEELALTAPADGGDEKKDPKRGKGKSGTGGVRNPDEADREPNSLADADDAAVAESAP